MFNQNVNRKDAKLLRPTLYIHIYMNLIDNRTETDV